MRSTIIAAVLAGGGLLAAGGKADAQVFYPYGPSYNYNYGVNPYTGAGYSNYNYGVPGYGYSTSTYSNPYTGAYGQRYGVSNLYGNSYYQNTYVNPYTGRGVNASYTVFPNGMYRGYYRRW